MTLCTHSLIHEPSEIFDRIAGNARKKSVSCAIDMTMTHILPRLLERSKKCRGHYSTIYHATLQWIMRTEVMHKIRVQLKFKIMWCTVVARTQLT